MNRRNIQTSKKPEDEPPNLLLGLERIVSIKEISDKYNLSEEELENICKKYPLRINGYYYSLIKEKGDGIYKQCIPSKEELEDHFGNEDPLNEEPENQERKEVPSLLTHRYPDRVLFRISNECAMYCRFCTRKRKIGDPKKQPKKVEIIRAINYIKEKEEIRDVILSGGDPLMLSNNYLDKILGRIHPILSERENSIIRIGTRIPCVFPQRINEDLCKILKKYHPLYINTHFNHPSEITSESKKACEMIVDSGIPLGNQTVLLKGVNDDPKIMKELMQKLVSIRIKPYYIYQCDPVLGVNHFRTRVEKGLEIIKEIRGYTSGLCVPHFVIDAPGGGGKIPLLPEYLQKLNDKKVILKNYKNCIYEYIQAD